jgi:hypothetical protein
VYTPNTNAIEAWESEAGTIAPTRERYSLALGLNRHPRHEKYPEGNPGLVTRFAAKTTDVHEVLAYPELLERKDWLPAEVGLELESQLLAFMNEAEHIHFQLDGLVVRGHGRRMQPRQVQSIRDALARGVFGTAIPRNVTNWELCQVWNHFRDKTTFYWKRKVIALAEILT